MLNKGSIFSGKRDLTTPQPNDTRDPRDTRSDTRPTPQGAIAPVPPTTQNVTPLPTKTEAPAHPATTQEAAPQGAKLIVGPGVKLKGAEIQDCDTLVVEGRVEATMDSRFIQIADHGSFDGKVNIDVAEIHGRFAGELTAREQLVIYATGHVSGKIRYGKIVIHEGGELSGDVKSLSASEAGGISEFADTGIGKLLASG